MRATLLALSSGRSNSSAHTPEMKRKLFRSARSAFARANAACSFAFGTSRLFLPSPTTSNPKGLLPPLNSCCDARGYWAAWQEQGDSRGTVSENRPGSQLAILRPLSHLDQPHSLYPALAQFYRNPDLIVRVLPQHEPLRFWYWTESGECKLHDGMLLMYAWIKALHIIAVISWMAGML
jgi:hypothetical protein